MRELRISLQLAILVQIFSEKLSVSNELAIQRSDHKRFALFHKVQEDAVLNGHVLSVYQVFSEMECLQRCLSCGQCMSFNFERQISESRHDCELNAMTTALSGDALESRIGFSYYEPIKGFEFDGKLLPKANSSVTSSAVFVMSSPPVVTSFVSLLTSNQPAPSPLSKTSSDVLGTPSDVPQMSLMTSVQPETLSSWLTSSSGFALNTLSVMTSVDSWMTSRQPVTLPSSMTITSTIVSTSSVMTTSRLSASSNNLLTSSVQQMADCKSNWHQYKTGCVRLFTIHKIFGQARQYCKHFQTSGGVKGDLVEIMSRDDNERIDALASEQGEYFIGLRDHATEGVYEWVGGSPVTYTNWKESHSNIENTDCVVMDTNWNGKWKAVPCNYNYRFICECKGACT